MIKKLSFVYSACGRRKGESVSQIGQKEKDKWCNLEHFCVIVKKSAWEFRKLYKLRGSSGPAYWCNIL